MKTEQNFQNSTEATTSKIPKIVKTQFANSQQQNEHSRFMMTWYNKIRLLHTNMKAWKLPAETVKFLICLIMDEQQSILCSKIYCYITI